jgi:hypothetical protein
MKKVKWCKRCGSRLSYDAIRNGVYIELSCDNEQCTDHHDSDESEDTFRDREDMYLYHVEEPQDDDY